MVGKTHQENSDNTLTKLKVNFRDRVCSLVSDIPEGKVMSYGQVAALCGEPRAARIVGGIAHYGPEYLPWHRIVKKDGGLASGYYGGLNGHKIDLERENVVIVDYKVVDIESLRWWPNE